MTKYLLIAALGLLLGCPNGNDNPQPEPLPPVPADAGDARGDGNPVGAPPEDPQAGDRPDAPPDTPVGRREKRRGD